MMIDVTKHPLLPFCFTLFLEQIGTVGVMGVKGDGNRKRGEYGSI